MSLLTPFQEKIVKEIADSPLQHEFHLTGGTALAELYLQHRYSLDLVFFTADPNAVSRVSFVLDGIADRLNAKVTYMRTSGSFLQCFLENPEGERVQIDFSQDSPYRLEPLETDESLGVQVESLMDIACNKLSALFDRAEPKDFVDVFFICQEVVPFDELVEKARKKHPGMDDYWLAIALQRVEQIELLPWMIKPVDIGEMKRFSLNKPQSSWRRSIPRIKTRTAVRVLAANRQTCTILHCEICQTEISYRKHRLGCSPHLSWCFFVLLHQAAAVFAPILYEQLVPG